MKKLLSLLLVCMACLAANADKTYTFQLTDNWDAMSSTYGDATAWSTSYTTHTLSLTGCTLELSKFSKQSSTVTDCPVTKAGPVTFKLTSTTAHILSAEIQCEKWGSKAKTVTLNTSTDGGRSFTATSTKSYDFEPSTGTFTTDEAVNAVKWSFSSTGTRGNQVGVKYVTIVTDEKVSSVKAPTFSLEAGTYYAAQTVTISAEEGCSIKYSTDNETFTDYTAPVTIAESCTLYAKAVKGEEESSIATAAYVIGKTYASLAELVAAGAPTATKVPVQLTLTNDKITGLYNNGYGSINGIYLKSGDQQVEIYNYNVPETWEKRGTVSGTVTGDWFLYTSSSTGTSTWELQISDWTKLTYTAPVQLFTTKDTKGKEIKDKFTTQDFIVKYNEDPTDLTFKVNDVEKTYDAEAGLTVEGVIGSKTNDVYKVSVYNGSELVGEQEYTYIPTFNISTYKTLADGTEAILSLAAGNKVTYSKSNNTYLEDASKGILAYNTGLTFTAYKQLSASTIWGKKTTYNNVAEITVCDSTASCSSITQTDADVTPTALTVAQTLLDNNQLRYAKVAGAKITKDDSDNYYAVAGSSQILLSDKFSTLTLNSLETLPCYADVTGIVSIDKDGNKYVAPIAIENISDNVNGTCGDVTWTIDLDGNMVFAPTDGENGTLAQTGTAASKRPWASYVTSVKTVKFNAGVSTTSDNSYMFKDMANLETVDFTNFNTSQLTTMKGLFNGCSSLKAADMSMLDLSKVTTFNMTFNACSALETVDFGENTLAAVTDFTSTFYSCHALKSLDFSKVTGAAVTKMATMLYDCTALESVDFRAFSTSKVSSAANAKNVFGTGTYAALPSKLVLNKAFGLTAVADTYITLPAATYKTLDNAQSFDLSVEQGTFYTYNESLEHYGEYIIAKTGTVTVSAAEYATFVAPFNVDFTGTDVTAYAVQNKGSYVNLEAVTTVPEGAAVVVKAAEGTYDIVNCAEASLGEVANDLKAATSEITADGSQYILANGTAGVGFYPAKTGSTIAVGKGYLEVTSGAKAYYPFGGDETTSINAVNVVSSDDAIYNINGQRVAQPVKGVNIINGKKVVIK